MTDHPQQYRHPTNRLPPPLRLLREYQNNVLGILHDAGKLGYVLFQFSSVFAPTRQNMAHILHLRAKLDARFAMAVEFRHRLWYSDPDGAHPSLQAPSTPLAFLSAHSFSVHFRP